MSIAAPSGSECAPCSSVPSRLLSVEEARAELNIGRTLVYQLIWSGALPVVRIGHALRVRRADLDTYVEVNLTGRVPKPMDSR